MNIRANIQQNLNRVTQPEEKQGYLSRHGKGIKYL